jgi:hypothetical protein
VQIQRGSESIGLQKTDSGWRLIRPLDSASDSTTVDALLRSLTSLRISRSMAGAPERMQEFGLDAPKATLEIQLKDGKKHRLRLGAKDFSGLNVYAQIDDAADVAIVSQDLLNKAEKPVVEFRDRRIAVFDEAKLKRVRLKNKQFTLVAEKEAGDDGKWLVREPSAKKGWEFLTSRIFLGLENARAMDIIDAPQPQLRVRLAKPEIEIELSETDGKTHRIVFISSGKEEFYALSNHSPLVFRIESQTWDAANSKLDDILREPEKPKPQESKPAETPQAEAPPKKP